jgi:hypothetical protein
MSEQAVADDFARHEAVKRAGIIVMERLRKLVRKGYRPDFDMEFTESIWLRHPAKTERWPHSTLILFPDGLLVSIEPQDEPRIAVWEKAEFEAFLRKVPLPTWWERTQDRRDRMKALVFIAAFTGLFVCGVGYGVMFLGRFLGLRP